MKHFLQIVRSLVMTTLLFLLAGYTHLSWGQTTVGPSFAGAGADVTGVGTVSWTSPGSVTANDNSYATVTIDGTDSHYLQATNYGFSIPLNATINGITVTIGRYGTIGGGQDVRDNVVSLVKAGVITGSNYAVTGTDWTDTESAVSYGDAANLWGTGWTPADINASNFGVALAVNSTKNRTAYVDYIQLTVSYVIFTNPWVITTAGASSFTVPAGVTCIQVEAWGGGGRGGSRIGGSGGYGGGGGGAYSRNVLTVIPGTTYPLYTGAGSTTTASGEDSYFINTTTLLAKGGGSVPNNSGIGVPGGAAANGVGDVKWSGGNGANGVAGSYGGGGGSSAGSALDGNTATNATGATAPTGGGNGGNGRTGTSGNGSPGMAPGGGGGGALRTAGDAFGGKGADGQIIISWGSLTGTLTPVVSSPIFSDAVSISGTSEANAVVVVYSGGSIQIGTGTADGSGVWSAPVSTLTTGQSITATAKVVDKCLSPESAPVIVIPVVTITTGTISPATFCAGSAVSVPYIVSGTFAADNLFTAQLSDAAGSFTTPVTLGTVASTASGTVSGTIPSGTSTGTAYRIRVVSSNPAKTGTDNGVNLTVNALPTVNAGGPDTVCEAASAFALSGASFSGGATSAAWSIVSGGGTLSSTAQTATPETVMYTPDVNYTGTVILRLTTAGGSCAAIADRAITINICINKWKGTISTNWNTSGNWALNYVPAVDDHIIFDTAPVNHCLLDQDRSVTDITNAQATYRLVTNGYKLTIKGNLNFTGGAQIDASAASSSVEFAGAVNQSIPAGAFYTDEVYNLIVNNANNVSLNGTLRLLNSLSATSGLLDAMTNTPNVIYAGTGTQTIGSQFLNDEIHLLTIDNTAGVTLNSNFTLSNDLVIHAGKLFSIAAGKTLSVSGAINNSAGSAGFVLQSDASGTASLIHQVDNVPATFNRYISGADEAWHFLSSPVSNQSIDGSWLPSGTYGNGTGYDLYAWNEPTYCWIYKLNTTSAVNWNTVHPGSDFAAGRGYLYSNQVSGTTKAFMGNLNNGSVSYSLTTSGTDLSLKGFNLIGNPYPSSIDWQTAAGWSRSNLLDSGGGYDMWIWNPTADNYGVFNSFSGVGTNGIIRYIAPMQGYFVRAASAGNLGTDNSVRVHDGTGSWKSARINPEMLSLVVRPETGTSCDETRIMFGYDASQTGAAKLFSPVVSAPSLYLPSGSGDYSVRYLTDTIDHPFIPVMFKAGTDGSYTLSCSFDEHIFKTVLLKDRQKNIIQNLKIEKIYRFIASAQDDPDRFVLYFKPVTTGSEKELPVRIYTDGIGLIVDLRLISQETEVSVFDLLGRKLLEKNLQGGSRHALGLKSVTQILLVCVKNQNGSFSRKLFWGN